MSQHSLALARVQARSAGQGVGILAGIEERREREQELERELRGQKRARKADRQATKGRFFGSLLGGLGGSILLKLAVGALAGSTGGLGLLALQGLTKGSSLLRALATGAGSLTGQKFATGSGGGVFGLTAGDVGLGRRAAARDKLGSIDVGSFQRSRGRERETEFRERERVFGEDLLSFTRGGAVEDFKNALVFQELLSGLFGGAKGVSFGSSVEQSLSRNLTGQGPAPGSIQRSLLGALGQAPQGDFGLSRLKDLDRNALLAMINSMGL